MTDIDRHAARWAEGARLTTLLQSAADRSDLRHDAAMSELVDRIAHITVDAFLQQRGSAYAESSPISRIGSSGGSRPGRYASITERKADHLADQDAATRLALTLLEQLKPRHRVVLLIDTYRTRLCLSRQGAADNWQQLAGGLQLTAHFEPKPLRPLTLQGLDQAARACRRSMKEKLEGLLALHGRNGTGGIRKLTASESETFLS